MNETKSILTKKKKRQSERIVKRQKCIDMASSRNMDIVQDLTLRKR